MVLEFGVHVNRDFDEDVAPFPIRPPLAALIVGVAAPRGDAFIGVAPGDDPTKLLPAEVAGPRDLLLGRGLQVGVSASRDQRTFQLST